MPRMGWGQPGGETGVAPTVGWEQPWDEDSPHQCPTKRSLCQVCCHHHSHKTISISNPASTLPSFTLLESVLFHPEALQDTA